MQSLRSWILFSIAAIFIALFNNPIWAQHSTSIETDEEMIEDFAERATSGLKGRVIWEAQDLSQTTVQIYKDEDLKNLYTGVTQLNSGEFEVRVEPGRYYLVALVDLANLISATAWGFSASQTGMIQINRNRSSRSQIAK